MPKRIRKKVKHYDGHCHELTFSCYQRSPLFTNDHWRALFYEALGRAVNRHHYRLFAFVVMPEHVHLLVQPKQDGSSVSSLLNAVKRPFSFRIKKLLTDLNSPLLAKLTIQQRPGITTFRFWQEGPGYDRNLTSPKAILSAIDYIHNNPVRRGLCQRAVDWKWSSACHYLEPGMEIPEDLVNIDPLPPDLLDDGAVI